jgi:outer membrane protein assembly factor BamB
MLTLLKLVLPVSLGLFVQSCGLPSAAAVQWPQFGGPQRDFALERDPIEIQELAVSQLWQSEPGDGKSGLVVDDHLVYVCFRKDKPASESAGNTNYVEGIVALDRQTGHQRWIHQYDCSDLDEQESFSGDPRCFQATPALAAGRIVSLGFTGRLVCVTSSSGELVWEKDLVADHQIDAKPVQFGFAASPVVIDGRLLVFAGGETKGLLCLDLSDGSEIWSCDCGEATYATPVVATLSGTQQIIVVTTSEVVSVDEQTGSVLWRSELPESGLTNVPCPLPIGNDRLLISGQGAKGTYCLEVNDVDDQWNVRQLWRVARPQFFYCNWIPIAGGSVALGCTESMLMAVSTEDGKLKGRWRGFGNGNLLRIGDQIICINGKGDLSLLSMGTSGLTADFRCGTLGGRVWAPPTLADDQLFVRSGRTVACYRIGPGGDLTNRLDTSESLNYLD